MLLLSSNALYTYFAFKLKFIISKGNKKAELNKKQYNRLKLH
jgi:hypothetical protein